MDNFDNINFTSESRDKPTPSDQERKKPIPFDDNDIAGASVSHSPLNIGAAAEVPKLRTEQSALKKPAEKILSSAERITGVKTFFTKLHAGAIDYLDSQINEWLKTHPGLTIKRTNTATGDVVGKKSEPSIIVTIWY